jgi:hypothetical protein
VRRPNDKNAIELTARDIHEVSYGRWQAQGVRAQLQPELVIIADLADGPGRQLDRAPVVQRRELPRTHAWLLAQAWRCKGDAH